MKPWIEIARAAAPDGGQLVLTERDGEFAIKVGGSLLMSSRSHGSEEAMAAAALTAPNEKRTSRTARTSQRILIGGLGFGYTLGAVLALAHPRAEIIVAELFSAVITWNQGPLGHLAGHPLRDRRVRVVRSNVFSELRPGAGFTAALLDVDNGPQALTTRSNRSLYQREGLAQAHAALAPEGTLVVWSAAPDSAFANRLRAAGFAVEIRSVAARGGVGGRGGRGGTHTLFVGKRAAT